MKEWAPKSLKNGLQKQSGLRVGLEWAKKSLLGSVSPENWAWMSAGKKSKSTSSLCQSKFKFQSSHSFPSYIYIYISLKIRICIM